MNQWSALVYGRTYEVDFRLIAMPKDFNDEDKKWALKYILGTTRSPGKLPQQPCWSFFKNDKYCVVGVTCMARELIGDSSNDNAEDFTRDKSTSGGLGRPLYGFFGYVAKLDGQNLPPIPKYLDTNLEAFKPLYDYIKQCWYVKNYESASREAIRSKYQEISYEANQPILENLDQDYFDLNFNDDQTRLWLEEDKENLWLTAVQKAKESPDVSLSLCLNLASQRDALRSNFLNATAFDVRQKEDIPRQIERPVQKDVILPQSIVSISEEEYIYGGEQPQFSGEKEMPVETAEVLGVVVGGLLGLIRVAPIPGFAIGGGIPGLIIGAGIGWIAAGYLSNKGIGGTIREQFEDCADSRGSKSRSRKRVSREEDIDYGWTGRKEQDSQNNPDNRQKNDHNWF